MTLLKLESLVMSGDTLQFLARVRGVRTECEEETDGAVEDLVLPDHLDDFEVGVDVRSG